MHTYTKATYDVLSCHLQKRGYFCYTPSQGIGLNDPNQTIPDNRLLPVREKNWHGGCLGKGEKM